MAEQTRKVSVSAIRTALAWYQQAKGMPSLGSLRAAIELQSALDSDEPFAELESRISEMSLRIACLEHPASQDGRKA